jgi:O-antigen/teichoic acid export membrane protein
MVLGALVSALGAYLFQIIGGRALGPVGFAPVSVLWTLFFILGTVVLVPVEQHATREAASGRRVLSVGALVPPTATVALSVVLGVGFVLITLDRTFLRDPAFLLIAAVLFASQGLFSLGRGLLAGRGQFRLVGWALIAESMGRLAMALLLLAIAPSAVALGWAMAVGAFTVLGTRFWRFDRASASGSASGASKFLGVYVAASAASQVLLAGAPLIVLGLGGGAEAVSVTFVLFTLFRAPLTMVYLLQGRVLPTLVEMVADEDRSRTTRLISLWFGVGAFLCLAGAATGYLVGPYVVQLLLGAEFRPTPEVAALVAGGVVAAVVTQLVGQMLVAEGRTTTLARVWSIGLVVASVVIVISDVSPISRVALAFALGELAAMVSMWQATRQGLVQAPESHDR